MLAECGGCGSNADVMGCWIVGVLETHWLDGCQDLLDVSLSGSRVGYTLCPCYMLCQVAHIQVTRQTDLYQYDHATLTIIHMIVMWGAVL